MSNTPVTTAFNTRQQQSFTAVYKDFDGSVDVTTPMTLTSDHPEFATVMQGADNRTILVTGVAVGAAGITVSFGPSATQQDRITVNVVAPPDLTSVSLTAGTITTKP